MDLFGDTITQPQTTKPSRENLALGFAEFWAAWPRGPRKVAKQQCLDKWARYECFRCWSHIVAHVEWMKTQPDWVKDGGAFICAPLVYLNQQRWADWEPVADTRPDVDPTLARLRAEAQQKKAIPPEARERIKQILGVKREL